MLVLIGAFAWLCLRDIKMLHMDENYTIVNEANKTITATIYDRNVDVKVGEKYENVDELVVFFDRELNLKYNPIVIVPKYQLIGVIEGGENGFIRIGNKVFQCSDKANPFTLLDNAAFFDLPPITEKQFENHRILFNSFEGLKKYGNTIILKIN